MEPGRDGCQLAVSGQTSGQAHPLTQKSWPPSSLNDQAFNCVVEKVEVQLQSELDQCQRHSAPSKNTKPTVLRYTGDPAEQQLPVFTRQRQEASDTAAVVAPGWSCSCFEFQRPQKGLLTKTTPTTGSNMVHVVFLLWL